MADRNPAVPYGARAWAEVDLDAAAANVGVLRARLREGTRVMAVLKADAYGHGAVPAARRLLRDGVDMIGVGDSSEAIELREAGITAPLLARLNDTPSALLLAAQLFGMLVVIGILERVGEHIK